MRRSRTFLFGALMVAGLLIGPGAGVAAAQPSGVWGATGWPCGSHGSVLYTGTTNGNGVVTTNSAARIDPNNMSQSAISCFFADTGPSSTALTFFGIEFGGACYYNAGMSIGVAFRHRIYAPRGNTATLVCWDGYFVCNDSAAQPAVPCAGTAAVTKTLRRET